jgi:coenzyme Q-binding protein COQ10
MPGSRETRRLPYSCEQMFDLVADVARYDEFLPWVVATRVRSDSETEMVADMLVGFKAIREKFTSRVDKSRPERIEVHYLDGPLRDLDNSWTFRPTQDGGCEIDFAVEFTFRNAVFEAIAGQYFDRAFRKMVEAFERRADDLYGRDAAPGNA